MKNYYWETTESHSNNTVTMTDYLENHLPDEFHVVKQEGSYAEIQSGDTANIYAVHAAGNGDFTHHFVRFELIS